MGCVRQICFDLGVYCSSFFLYRFESWENPSMFRQQKLVENRDGWELVLGCLHWSATIKRGVQMIWAWGGRGWGGAASRCVCVFMCVLSNCYEI